MSEGTVNLPENTVHIVYDVNDFEEGNSDLRITFRDNEEPHITSTFDKNTPLSTAKHCNPYRCNSECENCDKIFNIVLQPQNKSSQNIFRKPLNDSNSNLVNVERICKQINLSVIKDIRLADERNPRNTDETNFLNINKEMCTDIENIGTNVVQNKPLLPCIDCNFSCFEYSVLKKHCSTMHNNFTPFQCVTCHNLFVTYEGILSHVKTVHLEPNGVYCKICNLYIDFQDIISHVAHETHKSVVNDRNQSLEGNSTKVLPLAFFEEQYNKLLNVPFKDHMERSTETDRSQLSSTTEDSKPRNRSKRKGFQHHKRLRKRHYKLIQKWCPDCYKIFANIQSLRRHCNIIHGTLKLFGCYSCDERFLFRKQRSRHLKIVHGSIIKVQCKICSAYKNTEQKVNLHIARCFKQKKRVCKAPKTSNDLFSCADCNVQFQTIYSLNLHKVLFHGSNPEEEEGSLIQSFRSIHLQSKNDTLTPMQLVNENSNSSKQEGPNSIYKLSALASDKDVHAANETTFNKRLKSLTDNQEAMMSRQEQRLQRALRECVDAFYSSDSSQGNNDMLHEELSGDSLQPPLLEPIENPYNDAPQISSFKGAINAAVGNVERIPNLNKDIPPILEPQCDVASIVKKYLEDTQQNSTVSQSLAHKAVKSNSCEQPNSSKCAVRRSTNTPSQANIPQKLSNPNNTVPRSLKESGKAIENVERISNFNKDIPPILEPQCDARSIVEKYLQDTHQNSSVSQSLTLNKAVKSNSCEQPNYSKCAVKRSTGTPTQANIPQKLSNLNNTVPQSLKESGKAVENLERYANLIKDIPPILEPQCDTASKRDEYKGRVKTFLEDTHHNAIVSQSLALNKAVKSNSCKQPNSSKCAIRTSAGTLEQANTLPQKLTNPNNTVPQSLKESGKATGPSVQIITSRVVKSIQPNHFCIYCYQICSTEGQLVTHCLTSHLTSYLYECYSCKTRFINRQSRLEHMHKTHYMPDGFVCKTCGNTKETEHEMDCHLYTCSMKPLSCWCCTLLFDSQAEFDIHKAEAAAKPYSCKSCTYRFATKSELDTHQAIHRKLLNILQDIVVVNEMTSVETPVIQENSSCTMPENKGNNNKEVPKKLYSCNSCSLWFASIEQLETHQAVHAKSLNILTCNMTKEKKRLITNLYSCKQGMSCALVNKSMVKESSSDNMAEGNDRGRVNDEGAKIGRLIGDYIKRKGKEAQNEQESQCEVVTSTEAVVVKETRINNMIKRKAGEGVNEENKNLKRGKESQYEGAWCAYCYQPFYKDDILLDHCRGMHSKSTPYGCVCCNHCFSTDRERNFHLTTTHAFGKPRNKFKCMFCSNIILRHNIHNHIVKCGQRYLQTHRRPKIRHLEIVNYDSFITDTDAQAVSEIDPLSIEESAPSLHVPKNEISSKINYDTHINAELLEQVVIPEQTTSESQVKDCSIALRDCQKPTLLENKNEDDIHNALDVPKIEMCHGTSTDSDESLLLESLFECDMDVELPLLIEPTAQPINDPLSVASVIKSPSNSTESPLLELAMDVDQSLMVESLADGVDDSLSEAASVVATTATASKVQCHYCIKGFKNHGKLLQHCKKIHYTSKPYICYTCVEQFETENERFTHTKENH